MVRREKPRQGWTKIPFVRIIYFHMMVRHREYPNSFSLARHFGVANRTAFRDIVFYRKRLHAPIKFDWDERGFYLTRPYSLEDALIKLIAPKRRKKK